MNVLLLNIGRFENAKAGTERVLCNMANALSDKGYEVVIVNTFQKTGDSPFPLKESVKVVNAGAGECAKLSVIQRIRRSFILGAKDRHKYDANILDKVFAKFIGPVIADNKPDIIICYQVEGTRILKNLVFPNAPIITMFHFNPEYIFDNNFDKSMDETLSALAKSDRVQVLLESYIAVTEKRLGSRNVVYIPNAVPQFNSMRADVSGKVIIHVGRFSEKQKRQHLLIDAFRKVAELESDWILELWGEADKESKYYNHCKSLVKKYGLQDRVRFCGTTDRIIDELQKASIFAFPSAYEGFPLALTEAMSLGLPSVGHKNCPAVNELIVDGRNGILCDDGIDSLAKALLELMQDEAKRKQYGSNAKKHMEQYASQKVWDMWESLIGETVSEYVKN